MGVSPIAAIAAAPPVGFPRLVQYSPAMAPIPVYRGQGQCQAAGPHILLCTAHIIQPSLPPSPLSRESLGGTHNQLRASYLMIHMLRREAKKATLQPCRQMGLKIFTVSPFYTSLAFTIFLILFQIRSLCSMYVNRQIGFSWTSRPLKLDGVMYTAEKCRCTSCR